MGGVELGHCDIPMPMLPDIVGGIRVGVIVGGEAVQRFSSQAVGVTEIGTLPAV